ncbi:hypothetical protein Pelo_696 [Pelomyxa schiedti]|nr:hypothetical protein Pelo_696 [Pelomyxa schiedti]
MDDEEYGSGVANVWELLPSIPEKQAWLTLSHDRPRLVPAQVLARAKDKEGAASILQTYRTADNHDREKGDKRAREEAEKRTRDEQAKTLLHTLETLLAKNPVTSQALTLLLSTVEGSKSATEEINIATLLQTIKQFLADKCWKKRTGTKPSLGASTVIENFVGRKETLDNYQMYLEFACSSQRNLDQRHRNPLLLEYIACSMREYCLAQTGRSPSKSKSSKDIALEVVQSWVPILITFNSSSMWKKEERNKPASFCLVKRILCSYFVESEGYASFIQWMGSKFDGLTVVQAIEMIFLDSRASHMFLGVDEIVKTKKFCKHILTEIGGVLDHFDEKNPKRVFSLVTSLDALYVKELETSSGRKITWIPLPALKYSDSVSLFDALPSYIKDNESVKCVISDCGGHPRSLEWLYLAVKDVPETEPTKLSYSSITAEIEKSLRCTGTFCDFPLDWLKPVLLGTQCNLTDIVGQQPNPKDSSSSIHITVKDLIKSGYYCNSQETVHNLHVVPRMTPLQIQLWAKNQQSKTTLDGQVARLILEYLITGLSWPTGSSSGQKLEEFHFGWESLVGILQSSEQITLEGHYKGATFIQGSNENQLEKTPLLYPTQKAVFTPMKEHFKQDHVPYLQDNPVIMPGKGNPGFDIVRRFEQTDGSNIFVGLEMKYADETSKSGTSATTIIGKYRKAILPFPGQTFALAVISRQKLPKLEKLRSLCGELPSNFCIALIPRQAFTELYGPTLGMRPRFIVSLKKLDGTPSSSGRQQLCASASTPKPIKSLPRSKAKTVPTTQGESEEEGTPPKPKGARVSTGTSPTSSTKLAGLKRWRHPSTAKTTPPKSKQARTVRKLDVICTESSAQVSNHC